MENGINMAYPAINKMRKTKTVFPIPKLKGRKTKKQKEGIDIETMISKMKGASYSNNNNASLPISSSSLLFLSFPIQSVIDVTDTNIVHPFSFFIWKSEKRLGLCLIYIKMSR